MAIKIDVLLYFRTDERSLRKNSRQNELRSDKHAPILNLLFVGINYTSSRFKQLGNGEGSCKAGDRSAFML